MDKSGKNILLINAKFVGGQSWVPLGIAYIASYLRKHNFNVKIFDNNLQGKNDLTLLINQFNPRIVGISAMTLQSNDAIKTGIGVKKINADLRLVYGGVHFTFVPEDGLTNGGDLVVLGEGEETFLKVCESHELGEIKGIVFRKNGETIRTERNEFTKNLDDLPLPAYDLLEMARYNDRFITGEKAVSIMTGRGCPYNCEFCASPQLWRQRVRYHSLEYVQTHIDFLEKNYGFKNFRIMDDTFSCNEKRVFDFCDMILNRKKKLNLSCLTNVKNANYEMFKRMKEAGFSIVAFGVESGNEGILKLINKNVTLAEVRKAVSSAKKAGLNTELLFMIGNIGETKETIIDTIKLAKEINPPNSNAPKNACWNYFQFATPNPGSVFFDIAKQYGTVVTNDWNKYTHQEPMFIPNGLDRETLIELKNYAFKETNAIESKFSWVPSIIKENSIVKKVYGITKYAS